MKSNKVNTNKGDETMTTNANRDISLTDTDGRVHYYNISWVKTGWRVVGEDIDQLVPSTSVFFPTAASIVTSAYASI